MASPMSRYAGGNCPPGVSLSVVGKGGTHFVVCGWERGAQLGWVKDAAPLILQCNATMAVLTLGGNDLNNRDCQPDQLAKDILNVARSLIRVDGFQKVAICQLQYRYPLPAPACTPPLHGNTHFDPTIIVWLTRSTLNCAA